MEFLSTEIGIVGIPRTQEIKGQPWGQGRVERNTEDPAAEAGEGLCSLPGQSAPDSTHSPLWMELLSTEIGTVGIPRTQETKGQPWGQGRVEWNTEDPILKVFQFFLFFPYLFT